MTLKQPSVQDSGSFADSKEFAGVDAVSADTPSKQLRLSGRAGSSVWAKWSGLGVLLALVVIFSILRSSVFDTSATVGAVLIAEPVDFTIGLAALATLVVGQFDLSIGYTLGIASVLTAWIVTVLHVSIYFAVGAALGCGIVIGAINAVLVLVIGINPFIATLGSGTIISGLILEVTHGNILTGLPHGYTANIATMLGGFFPVGTFYVIALGLIAYLVLHHMVAGRAAIAVGSNPTASRLAGLPTRGITGAAFIVGGVLAAGAGLLDLGAIGSAYPTIGPDFLLPAFAVAFLGRTMVRPGEFNVGGMALASLILAVGVTGLTEMGIASWVTPVFDGGVLIITVTIAILRGGRDAPFHLG